MALPSDHWTLMQVERNVERLDDHVRELTKEVDGMDVSPEYSCDCSCDGIIGELEDDIQDLYKRIEKLEAILTGRPGTTT
jgi:hypothetical protein